jgi:hypothetical protein
MSNIYGSAQHYHIFPSKLAVSLVAAHHNQLTLVTPLDQLGSVNLTCPPVNVEPEITAQQRLSNLPTDCKYRTQV